MMLFPQIVPLEDYIEKRNSIDLNNVEKITIEEDGDSNFVKIYYKSPQPIKYKDFPNSNIKYPPIRVFES